MRGKETKSALHIRKLTWRGHNPNTRSGHCTPMSKTKMERERKSKKKEEMEEVKETDKDKEGFKCKRKI